ncbi:hypothetical protein DdX_00760 [Ditylenchus destructor]|uniref:Uncharacterized protein n=1 Tax=Ditylenchus destructor TaxID=166010 RepID=A0AAD4NHM6_9BILA|nr:hypothetical protein DdX_00760 [Ditylenchus destructor]
MNVMGRTIPGSVPTSSDGHSPDGDERPSTISQNSNMQQRSSTASTVFNRLKRSTRVSPRPLSDQPDTQSIPPSPPKGDADRHGSAHPSRQSTGSSTSSKHQRDSVV